MKFTNVSPLGDLDITGVGHVAAGAQFDGPDDLAGQAENFAPADPAPVAPATPTTKEKS